MKKSAGRKERRKLARHNRRKEGRERMKYNEKVQKGLIKETEEGENGKADGRLS